MFSNKALNLGAIWNDLAKSSQEDILKIVDSKPVVLIDMTVDEDAFAGASDHGKKEIISAGSNSLSTPVRLSKRVRLLESYKRNSMETDTVPQLSSKMSVHQPERLGPNRIEDITQQAFTLSNKTAVVSPAAARASGSASYATSPILEPIPKVDVVSRRRRGTENPGENVVEMRESKKSFYLLQGMVEQLKSSPKDFFSRVSSWTREELFRKKVSFIRYVDANVQDSLTDLRVRAISESQWDSIVELVLSGLESNSTESILTLRRIADSAVEANRLVEFKLAVCLSEVYDGKSNYFPQIQGGSAETLTETPEVPRSEVGNDRLLAAVNLLATLQKNGALPMGSNNSEWKSWKLWKYIRVGRLIRRFPGLLQLKLCSSVLSVSKFAGELNQFLACDGNAGLHSLFEHKRIWNSPEALRVLKFPSLDTCPSNQTSCICCSAEGEYYPPICKS
eukprot:ANDGO_08271.mRNA.1 hypothetical protein